jgi:hypothetical protein
MKCDENTLLPSRARGEWGDHDHGPQYQNNEPRRRRDGSQASMHIGRVQTESARNAQEGPDQSLLESSFRSRT